MFDLQKRSFLLFLCCSAVSLATTCSSGEEKKENEVPKADSTKNRSVENIEVADPVREAPPTEKKYGCV